MIAQTIMADGMPLLVRRLRGGGPSVLYVHGATFPSALSVAYRFAGRYWMDALAARGFDVWAFDFAGFGGSARYAEMALGEDGPALGRAPGAAGQIACVAAHIRAETGRASLALIAHSWGTMPAGLYAAAAGARVHALCLFGPIAQRAGQPSAARERRWRTVTVAEQLARFVEDVPPSHPGVLIEPGLENWGPDYLSSDPQSATRVPPSVKIPGGPAADIAAAWSGALPWRPQSLRCPVQILRGAWDGLCGDFDARWLQDEMACAPSRDVKLPGGTHLMHLERGRERLFAAAADFLEETAR